MLYLMSVIEEEGNLPYEWYMKVWIQYPLNSYTYWQDEINMIWPREEHEVVGNSGSYDEGTMYKRSWERNIWRKVKEEFVKDISIVT